MLDFWGKSNLILGRQLHDEVPEIKVLFSKSESHYNCLQKVWESGLKFQIKGHKKIRHLNGLAEVIYYDVCYQPFRNPEGSVYAILHTAINVTERVLLSLKRQAVKAPGAFLKSVNTISNRFEQPGLLISSEEVTQNVENRQQIENNYEDQKALAEELSVANKKLVDSHHLVNVSKEKLEKLLIDLTAAEFRFRQMVKEAPIAICVLNGPDLIIESANALILNLWGKTASVINTPLAMAMPELKDQGFVNLLKNVFSTGIAYKGSQVRATLDAEGQTKDRYVNIIYQPIKNSAGITTSIMAVITDITEHVLAKNDYQRAVEMLDFSVKAADIGTWSIDLHTGKSKIDSRNHELFGFLPEEEISSSQLMEQVSMEFKEQLEQSLQKVVDEGGLFDITYSAMGFHDQKLRWIRTLGGIVKDQQGKPRYLSGVSIETTQQKQDELRKNEFISIVSHELKTPLTSIKGYIELMKLKAEKLDDKFITTALNRADSRIDKMTSIINGFLNVSQLESGKIELIQQTFVLEALLNEVADEANIYGKGKRIIFKGTTLTPVRADRDKIEQVICNLLSNADKYSPAGSVIEIFCSKDHESVTVKVKNSGSGILYEDQARIFERYFRVESQENKVISGFGIGLYLCKEIVARHEGTLWVESMPNEGSTFSFNLPLN